MLNRRRINGVCFFMFTAVSCCFGVNLFDSEGQLGVVSTAENINYDGFIASPGDVSGVDAVVRVAGKKEYIPTPWSTGGTSEESLYDFVLPFKGKQIIGSVLVEGGGKVSYLKDGESNWVELENQGDSERRLRFVTLPEEVKTKAIKVSGTTELNRNIKYSKDLYLLAAFSNRFVNIAPFAELSVSSTREPEDGFQPDPRTSDKKVLLDGSIDNKNWHSAPDVDEKGELKNPVWITLQWNKLQQIDACVLFAGRADSPIGKLIVQKLKDGAIYNPYDESAWETIKKVDPRYDIYPPMIVEHAISFDKTVQTTALRFVVPRVADDTQYKIKRLLPGKRENIGLGEIMVLRNVHDQTAFEKEDEEKLSHIVPIKFKVPEDGVVSLRIMDEDGEIIKNLVNGSTFTKGEHTVWWDLTTVDDYWYPLQQSKHERKEFDDDKKIAQVGKYRVEGIWHPELELDYLYSFYPVKKHTMPWNTADKTGGWLADHNPPQTIINDGTNIWIGTFNEAGDGIIQVDSDMKKLWGEKRIWLACPKVLAEDGDFVYFLEQGGWAKKVVMIQVDKKSRRTRRVFAKDIPDKKKNQTNFEYDIRGMAVIGQKAYIADAISNQVMVVDMEPNLKTRPVGWSWKSVYEIGEGEKMNVIDTISVDKPGRMRRFDDEHILMISGNSVVLVNVNDGTKEEIISGLKNPGGLAFDDKNIYVGEMEPLHIVKVFSREGKVVGTIGQRGGHQIGEFENNNLESPIALEVDTNGDLWVCEHNKELKRVSVWNTDGRCIKQVIGPTVYGGVADIDPRDENRFFYRGKELVRNPDTGEVSLSRIIWRGDNFAYDMFYKAGNHNPGSAAPAYPFYNNDKLYFTSYQGWSGGGSTMVWMYENGHVVPAAAIGVPSAVVQEVAPESTNHVICAWTDFSKDGKVQKDELTFGDPTFEGEIKKSFGEMWQFLLNDKFEGAVSASVGATAGITFFGAKEITADGYPVFELPKEYKTMPYKGMNASASATMTDSDGNAISMLSYIVSMTPEGKVNWRYKNRWPGLHPGHRTTATGEEDGVVIAPIRFYGSAYVDKNIGEIFCVGSNLGCTYLFTADGFYLDRIFQDSRVGLAWNFNDEPTPDVLRETSLFDEHFGGTFQKVPDKDGKSHYRYVVGKTYCAVVEVEGIEDIKKIKGRSIRVKDDDVSAALKLQDYRAMEIKEPKVYNVKKAADIKIDGNLSDWTAEKIDGFSLLYDDKFLYFAYAGRDDRGTFKNASTEDFYEAFKKGDVIDLKLQTKKVADGKRLEPAVGDIRLSFVDINGKPEVIIYDYLVPGTSPEKRVAFATARTIYIDRVEKLNDVNVVVKRRGDSYVLEAAIPLDSIDFDPTKTPVVKGDVGRVLSDQSGTISVSRKYWSNKDTNITSDVPTEAMIKPAMWGTLVFE